MRSMFLLSLLLLASCTTTQESVKKTAQEVGQKPAQRAQRAIPASSFAERRAYTFEQTLRFDKAHLTFGSGRTVSVSSGDYAYTRAWHLPCAYRTGAWRIAAEALRPETLREQNFSVSGALDELRPSRPDGHLRYLLQYALTHDDGIDAFRSPLDLLPSRLGTALSQLELGIREGQWDLWNVLTPYGTGYDGADVGLESLGVAVGEVAATRTVTDDGSVILELPPTGCESFVGETALRAMGLPRVNLQFAFPKLTTGEAINQGYTRPLKVVYDPYLGQVVALDALFRLTPQDENASLVFHDKRRTDLYIDVPTAQLTVSLELGPEEGARTPDTVAHYYLDDAEIFALNLVPRADGRHVSFFRKVSNKGWLLCEEGDLVPGDEAWLGRAHDGALLRLEEAGEAVTLSWEPAQGRKPVTLTRL